MKKKKSSVPPPATAEPTVPAANLDLKSLIRENSLFFDKLVELIPAKFYLPADDTKPYFKGLNKAAKQAAKQQTKENIKKARRDRHDPEKSQLSTLDLLKKSIETEKQSVNSILELEDDDEEEEEEVEVREEVEEEEEEEEGDGKPAGKDRSVTYEELRQKLHRRIDELRGNRGTGEKPKVVDKKEKREQHDINKRKRLGLGEEKIETSTKPKKTEDEIENEIEEASKEIRFGKVKLGDEDEDGGKKKKRRLSKVKELERAKKLEEAMKDPEKGEVVAKKHSWTAAVSRAAGVKVHDDPKLLKKSLHKEKKKHEKNAEKWKDRIETREKMKSEKQQKRAGNIAERINQKKARKIAKREKKLMRPGFEGRKDGYLNAN